jgi:hypothetical protein
MVMIIAHVGLHVAEFAADSIGEGDGDGHRHRLGGCRGFIVCCQGSIRVMVMVVGEVQVESIAGLQSSHS